MNLRFKVVVIGSANWSTNIDNSLPRYKVNHMDMSLIEKVHLLST